MQKDEEEMSICIESPLEAELALTSLGVFSLALDFLNQDIKHTLILILLLEPQ